MVLNNILLDVDNVLVGIVYLLACFALFAISKYDYRVLRKQINADHELVEKDNLAFAVSKVGYFVAILIILSAALSGESHGLVDDLIDIAIYGTIGIALLNWSMLFTDKVILPKFKVKKEIIEDQNVGTGVVEAAVAIGNGLIVSGAIGPDNGFDTGFLIWFVAGQVLFLIAAKVYDWITPYDVHDHIEKDNIAVGIGFAGALIGVANIVRFAIQGPFDSMYDLGMVLLFDFVIALALLPVVRTLVDKVILPKRKLTDEIVNQEHPNIGAALIEAFAYIGGSLLITWCL